MQIQELISPQQKALLFVIAQIKQSLNLLDENKITIEQLQDKANRLTSYYKGKTGDDLDWANVTDIY